LLFSLFAGALLRSDLRARVYTRTFYVFRLIWLSHPPPPPLLLILPVVLRTGTPLVYPLSCTTITVPILTFPCLMCKYRTHLHVDRPPLTYVSLSRDIVFGRRATCAFLVSVLNVPLVVPLLFPSGVSWLEFFHHTLLHSPYY